eukprot:TRINITY_DN45604_c0_g1_i1.p1 TRINITY_DN45604_c0_g1~~TRINITY_DN45604_c0_g1_i1.p1  ORF type:complete len:189 (-),score=25.36 TRINITY_DN45604_c0_g1_i1:104-670(-)
MSTVLPPVCDGQTGRSDLIFFLIIVFASCNTGVTASAGASELEFVAAQELELQLALPPPPLDTIANQLAGDFPLSVDSFPSPRGCGIRQPGKVGDSCEPQCFRHCPEVVQLGDRNAGCCSLGKCGSQLDCQAMYGWSRFHGSMSFVASILGSAIFLGVVSTVACGWAYQWKENSLLMALSTRSDSESP